MKTSSASEGMVCTRPTTPKSSCPARGRRAAAMPSGTATIMAAASESATSSRCSTVRAAIRRARPSICAAPRTPSALARKSAATTASGSRRSLTRAFISIISRAEMRPSSLRSAAAASAGRSLRHSSTAS